MKIKRTWWTPALCWILGHKWYGIGWSIYDGSHGELCARCPTSRHGHAHQGDQ